MKSEVVIYSTASDLHPSVLLTDSSFQLVRDLNKIVILFGWSFQFQCYLRTPNQTFSLFKTYSQVLIPRIIGTIVVACDNNTTTRTFMTSTALRCSGQHTVIHWIDKDNPVRRGHSCNSRHTTAPLLVVVVVVVARVVVDPFLSLHTLCERSQTS